MCSAVDSFPGAPPQRQSRPNARLTCMCSIRRRSEVYSSVNPRSVRGRQRGRWTTPTSDVSEYPWTSHHHHHHPPVDGDRIEGEVPIEEVDEPRSPVAALIAEAPFVTADGRFRKRRGRIRRFQLTWAVDEADCGPACLTMVCRHHGRTPSPARVRRAVGTVVDGTSLTGLVRGARQLGLASRGIRASRRNLDEMPLPAIVHWEGNHWTVLYDVHHRRVRLADPASGLRRLSRNEFDDKWSGYTVLCEPSDTFAELPEAPRARSWLLPLFRPYRRTVALAAALALVVAALQTVVPIFIQIVIDRVLPARDFGLLRVLLLSMGAVVIAMSLASFTQRYLLSRATVNIDGVTLDVLTAKLLALPLRFFYARRTGDIQRRVMGMRLVREFAVQQGVIALTSMAQVVAAVVLMFVYSWSLALIFLASVADLRGADGQCDASPPAAPRQPRASVR